jgi:hypothetical protein
VISVRCCVLQFAYCAAVMAEDFDALEVCCETVVTCVEPEICNCLFSGFLFISAQMVPVPHSESLRVSLLVILLTLASSFSFSQLLCCALCFAFRILNLSVSVDCTPSWPKFLIRFFFYFYLCSQHVSVITALHISKFILQFKVTCVYVTIYLVFVCTCLSISLVLPCGLHDICWN